jgi:hypothetical protein
VLYRLSGFGNIAEHHEKPFARGHTPSRTKKLYYQNTQKARNLMQTDNSTPTALTRQWPEEERNEPHGTIYPTAFFLSQIYDLSILFR